MPTPEQLASRQTLTEFLERMAKPVKKWGQRIKSEWFDRPDDELQGWIERGRAIAEIEDSMGYKLIMGQTEREIEWAREQLELGKLDATEMRMYLRSLRFFQDFILTVRKNADIASSVLAGREGSIARESHAFVKNAVVGER